MKKTELGSSRGCPKTGQKVTGHELRNTGFHLNTRKHCFTWQVVKQVVQRGCRLSILEDIHNIVRHSPRQLALADPVLSNGHGLDGVEFP